ncbi:MAG: hypothetical protein IJV47_06370 [Candidatus Methanomethylophilaceae archaeon]|nr:hypothetical protein [Candidatus Methanomethylophilaceae archaeon]MBQ9690213.1 hypothetical protein [Candidatus Methanomethylophilaceae archaeon]
MLVYYARAVDSRDWDEVQSERSRVIGILSAHGMEVINDFSDGFTSDKELVESQLSNLRKCDILIADLSIPDHPYIGCIGEIIYAHQFGKRVYVIYGDCDKILKRPWLSYHVDGFFKSYEELLDYIG